MGKAAEYEFLDNPDDAASGISINELIAIKRRKKLVDELCKKAMRSAARVKKQRTTAQYQGMSKEEKA